MEAAIPAFGGLKCEDVSVFVCLVFQFKEIQEYEKEGSSNHGACYGCFPLSTAEGIVNGLKFF